VAGAVSSPNIVDCFDLSRSEHEGLDRERSVRDKRKSQAIIRA
jgi:hypothetical protein